MTARKSGLGKGLDALIPSLPEDSALPEAGITQLPVQQIIPNPQQPRSKFDQEQLAELAASIREHGVIQPLVLTTGEQPDQYVIIAGERRWQAAKLAGLTHVPVVIREANNQDLLELALIENVQRADLSPLEMAGAFQRLIEEYALTQEQIAQRVGKSRVAITNTLRLLELCAEIKQALAAGLISEGHARPLHGLSLQAQKAALAAILAQGLNVRQVEELSRRYKGEKTPGRTQQTKKAPLPEIQDIQDRLRDLLQTEVIISHGGKGGSIILRYYSDEELNALVDRLIGDQG